MDPTVTLCISRQEKSVLGNAMSLFLFSSVKHTAVGMWKSNVMVEIAHLL